MLEPRFFKLSTPCNGGKLALPPSLVLPPSTAISERNIHVEDVNNVVGIFPYIQLDMMFCPYGGEFDLDTCGGNFKFQIFIFSHFDKVIPYKISFE